MRTYETPSKLSRAVAAGAVAAIALAGCAAEQENAPAAKATTNGPSCTFEQQDQWSKLPSNVDAAKIAKSLHISIDKAQRGGLGPVKCNPGVPLRYFVDATPVHIYGIPADSGLASECLPLVSDAGAKPGATVAVEPVVFCPAT